MTDPTIDAVENESSAVRKHSNTWRVVDIVVAAIIAVASGVIFWGWDIVCAAPLAIFGAVTPGFEGLLNRSGCSPARLPPSSCASLVPRCSPKRSPPPWNLPWVTSGASAVR